MKDLYLSRDFAPAIAAALQELVGARITEVFPSLRNIFVEGLEPSGLFQENLGQLSDYPITISVWEKDSNMDEYSNIDEYSDTDEYRANE